MFFSRTAAPNGKIFRMEHPQDRINFVQMKSLGSQMGMPEGNIFNIGFI